MSHSRSDPRSPRLTRPALRSLLQSTPPDAILRAADRCDGHTIYDPQAFIEAGLPEPLVQYLTREHRSSGTDPKSTLFVGGRIVPGITGVYGLELLRLLAELLDVTYTPCFGRGTEAARISAALHGRLGPGGSSGSATVGGGP